MSSTLQLYRILWDQSNIDNPCNRQGSTPEVAYDLDFLFAHPANVSPPECAVKIAGIFWGE